MLEVHYQTVGLAAENTFVVVNEKREALIFDPGDESARLIAWVKKNQWQPIAILLTHCHFDHIGAVDAIREEFGIEVYVHEIEKDFLVNPQLNLSYSLLMQSIVQGAAEHVWTQEDMTSQKIGSFEFRIAHVPGHSPGHVVYIFDGFVIAGDTLFKNSIGRTDFYLGDYHQLIMGIREKLFTLPDDYQVYPGHNEPTTIGEEKQLNPFFR